MMAGQKTKILVRPLQQASILPGLLVGFAHSQKITQKWVKQNDVWELTDVSLLREWSAEKRIWMTEYMCQQLERGGTTIGAFCNDRLIGFCCVDGTISGNSAKYANLTMLFVDDNWKRNGVGKSLLQEARNHATKLGAEKIFISAIPSAETIAFYQSMGCVDATEIVEVFVDSDDDRYLEYCINSI
jgi:ribosomal protein S18 acetylase RimI-like enzyme